MTSIDSIASPITRGCVEGLLEAQRMANAASAEHHRAGRNEAANALAALSTDLLLLREEMTAKADKREQGEPTDG